MRGHERKTKPALWRSAGIGIEAKPVVQPNKSVAFVKRVKKQALWMSVAGAKAVPGPVKPSPGDRARARFDRKRTRSQLQPGKTTPAMAKTRRHRPKTEAQKALDAEKRLYRQEARAFVAAAVERGERCPVVGAIQELRDGFKYGHLISDKLNEVHHKRGRGRGGRGPLLRDQRHWMAISKQGHRWVHSHVAEARARGWFCAQGEWNKPDRSAADRCKGCGCLVSAESVWCGECLCEEDSL